MEQTSITDGFEKIRKKTRKEQLLDDMKAIEPFYPNPKGASRRPIGIYRILCIYFLQHWFYMSDPAAEDATYDSSAMRQFVGIDLSEEPAPNDTTICKFRHLMENHNLADRLFDL
jgi:IS5 family transposase